MKIRILSLLATVLLFPWSPVNSAPLVELFTSQGCYSCPPADRHLAELIKTNPEVVALEFHVDYWDDLNYGAAGTWKDPFSDAAFSERQRQYNTYPLKGKRGVYTPQMVVNGATVQVGTNRQSVRKNLTHALPPLNLTVTREQQNIAVTIAGDYDANALVWLAVFDRQQVTDVVRGENKGKTMHNHHVVRELTAIAAWRSGGGSTGARVPALTGDNSDCAVFVQDRDTGRILAAEYC